MSCCPSRGEIVLMPVRWTSVVGQTHMVASIRKEDSSVE